MISPPEQIDLAIPKLPGFSEFIGCWCGQVESGFFLVDPGPTSTIGEVVTYLEERAISSLSAILLTHIHVDHAGGIGTLAALYPETPIICPARSIPHLVDPTRLEQSSRTVLGSLMDHYGPIKPVPKTSLVAAETSHWGAIPTPGHSPDHTAYFIDGYLFCGEALGVICTPQSQTYRRPATPPRFEKSPYLDSISKLEEHNPHTLCFGHFGYLSSSSTIFAESRAQIDRWTEIIAQDPTASDEAIIAQLLERDPLFSEFQKLVQPLQEREKIFVKNSIAGIRGYVGKQQDEG